MFITTLDNILNHNKNNRNLSKTDAILIKIEENIKQQKNNKNFKTITNKIVANLKIDINDSGLIPYFDSFSSELKNNYDVVYNWVVLQDSELPEIDEWLVEEYTRIFKHQLIDLGLCYNE